MNETRVRRMVGELRADPTAQMFAALLGLDHEVEPARSHAQAKGQGCEFLVEHAQAGAFTFTAWP